MEVISNARTVALGGNPLYSGNEFLNAQFSHFKLYARALTREELQQLAR
jgi:hypothetical protein